MSEDYWDGATFEYQAQITNGAGGSGDITVEITPGAGNEFEFLYGAISNGDTVTRTLFMQIRDSNDNVITTDTIDDINAGGRLALPGVAASSHSADRPAASGTHRRIVSGTMDILLTASAIAASQDATFTFTLRIRGPVPTITEAGQASPTITINTEQVV